MALGGLWHGAAWNFVLGGLYHGIILCIHRAINSIKSTARKYNIVFYDIAKITFFFIIICYGFVIFRSPSLDKVLSLTSTLIFDFGNIDFGIALPRMAAVVGLPIFFILEIIEKVGKEQPFYQKIPVPAWTALYAAIIFCTAIGMTTESTQFIYMVF